jgi:hypothetical protein
MKTGLGGAIAAGLLAAPLLGGCVIAIGGDGDDGAEGWRASSGHSGRYETLLGAEVDAKAGQVSVTASSSGCTQESSFRTDVDREDGVYEVGFRRTTADLCKALAPDGVRLAWTYAQLGIPEGARVRLVNPVGP